MKCEAECGKDAVGPIWLRTAIGLTCKHVCSKPCADKVIAGHWAQPAKRVRVKPIIERDSKQQEAQLPGEAGKH